MVFQIDPHKESEVGMWDIGETGVFHDLRAEPNSKPGPDCVATDSVPASDPVFAELAFLMDDLTGNHGSDNAAKQLEVQYPKGPHLETFLPDLPDSRELDVTIPPGLVPGEMFEVELDENMTEIRRVF